MKRKKLIRISLCVVLLFFSVDAFAAVASLTLPTPNIKASLSPGNENGNLADWWLVANQSPDGWYSFTSSGWTTGIKSFGQYPLSNISPVEIYYSASLTVGDYAFCVGVDMSPDGILDLPLLYYDVVQVHVVN